MIPSMTLALAMGVAATAATALGHALAPFEKDTNWSAVTTCVNCGRLAAVDIAVDAKDAVVGRATRWRCQGVPHGHHPAR